MHTPSSRLCAAGQTSGPTLWPESMILSLQSLRIPMQARRTSENSSSTHFVEVDQVGVGLLGPAPRGLVLLAGKDGHGNRDGDALGVEKATPIFPIEPRRRDPRVRQPIKRDVVEDLLPRQFARGARGPVQSRGDRSGRLAVSIIVVEKPGGQADR